jgi:pilus assembly protein Flp/PilA
MFLRKTEGQGLAEYALILALIAIIAIAALIFLGGQISTILSSIGKSL